MSFIDPNPTVIGGIKMMLPGMHKIGRLGVQRQICLHPLLSIRVKMISSSEDCSHEEFLEQNGGREYARDIAFTFDEALAYISLNLVDPTGYIYFLKAGGPHIEGDQYFFYLVSEIDDQLYVGQLGRWLSPNIDEWTLNAHTMDTYPPKQGKVFMIKETMARPVSIESSRSYARQVNDARPALSSKIAA